jgi:hypothetical protein
MNAAGDTYTATDWEPHEFSIVTVPADPTLGVGRALPRPAASQARRNPAPTVIATGTKPEPGSVEHACLHEAAHAVALSLGHIPFKLVRIFTTDSGTASGEVASIDTSLDARGLDAMVIATLAGAAAAAAAAAANVDDPTYRGSWLVSAGAAEDYRQAEEWVRQLCRDHDYERRSLILHGSAPMPVFERRVCYVVDAHQRQIYGVANELLALKKLTAAEVAELVS